jgi:serine/threonine protein kinase
MIDSNFTPEPNETSVEDNSEVIPKNIDQLLTQTIIEGGERVGEGDNAVVLKISQDEFPGNLRDALLAEKVDLDKDKAAKMLKLYSEGIGGDELRIQNKAYHILEKVSQSGKSCASIPEPHLYRNIELESEKLEDLKQKIGHDIKAKPELILMDFVCGDTLYEHLLRKVLQAEHDRAGNNAVSNFSKEDFVGELTDEMREIAKRVVNFKMYTNDQLAANNLDNKNAHELHKQNVEYLFDYLKHKKVRVRQSVISQLENAIDALHNQGVAHRDLHWENIMIDGDPFIKDGEDNSSKDPSVYIIDFGASTVTDSEETLSDVFTTKDRKYIADEVELERLKNLRPRESDVNSGISSPFTRVE